MEIISRARSRRLQMTVKLTGLSRTLDMACTAYHLSGAHSLEVVRRFSETLWVLALVPSPESQLPIYVWRLLVTLTHVRGEKSVLFLGSFFPGEVCLVTIRRLGGPQNRSGAVANREILSPAGGHNAVTQPVASRPSCLK
jgi:hypothetical protein